MADTRPELEKRAGTRVVRMKLTPCMAPHRQAISSKLTNMDPGRKRSAAVLTAPMAKQMAAADISCGTRWESRVAANRLRTEKIGRIVPDKMADEGAR